MNSINTEGTITLAYNEFDVIALIAIKNDAPNSSVKNKLNKKYTNRASPRCRSTKKYSGTANNYI